MRIAIAGSIATDHLMSYAGKFSDALVADQLDKISVSFLVNDLDIRRGGCAANIAFGLTRFGINPVLVGSVGQDFDDLGYRTWLTEAGVDCDRLHWSTTQHTARCTITTDEAQAQIVTFYPGAMSESREIDLAALHADTPFDIVLIGPDDPEGMVRHTQTARELQIPFAADPSQQLSFADGETIAQLVDGATYLFTNDYEAALITKKTGWDDAEVQSRVGTRIVTRGADGVTVYPSDGDTVNVKAIAGVQAVDPTGVGDSFRAGFLAARSAGLSYERAAQMGCTIAASVVETKGTQDYEFNAGSYLDRLEENYGSDARNEIAVALHFDA